MFNGSNSTNHLIPVPAVSVVLHSFEVFGSFDEPGERAESQLPLLAVYTSSNDDFVSILSSEADFLNMSPEICDKKCSSNRITWRLKILFLTSSADLVRKLR